MNQLLKKLLIDFLIKKRIYFVEDYDFSKYNSLKCSGKISLFVYPRNKNELKNLLKKIKDNEIKYFIIGNGTNSFTSGYEGVVISLKKMKVYFKKYYGKIKVSSNYSSQKIAHIFSNKLYEQFLFLSKIPGTIGGAICMNSSVFGYNCSDYLLSVKILDISGKIKIIKRNKINFQYRKSSFLYSNSIILEGCFKKKYNRNSKKIYDSICYKRSSTQPIGLSLGSIFKNNKDYYAGKLIEECGLKGFTYNGFKISDIHANIVLNIDKGNPKDFLNLLFIIELKVLLKHNVRLQKEILIF